MSGAAASNVLMFLTAMCGLGTVWLGVSAVGTGSLLYGIIAVLLAVATVIAFRSYRRVLADLDAEERRPD